MRQNGEIGGNGSVAILIHDTGDNALESLDRRVLSAMRHFGIPFRVCPLETELTDHLFQELISDYAALLFPQSGTCGRLSSENIVRMIKALEKGLGIVLYEPEAALLPGEIRSCFPIGTEKLSTGVFQQIHVRDNNHFITWLKPPGEHFSIDRPLDYTVLDTAMYPGAALLENEAGNSLVCQSGYGAGRLVLFPFSSALYDSEYLGHACGIDDLFTRSLIWAARKPFVTWSMPQMAGLVIDDCSGSYNHFEYVDILNNYGWKPYLALFTDTIDEVAHEDTGKAGKKLYTGWKQDLLEIGFHALRYNESFCFDHLGRRPLNRWELRDRFRRWDLYEKKWEIRHSKWAHPHFGEIGSRAIPFFRERGIEFLTYLLPLNAAWFEVPSIKPPIPPQPPFGHSGYYINTLPEDPEMMVFNCVLSGKYRESTDDVVAADYLWGNTCFWNESENTKIGAAARTLALQIRRGIDSGFYGEGATHEQRISCLRMGEWKEIMEETGVLLNRYKINRCPLSSIMEYEKKRWNTRPLRLIITPERNTIEYEFTTGDAVDTHFQIHTNCLDGRIDTVEHKIQNRKGIIEIPRQKV